jgi:hypothetical protein
MNLPAVSTISSYTRPPSLTRPKLQAMDHHSGRDVWRGRWATFLAEEGLLKYM